MFKKIHVLYTQSCIYREILRSEDGTTEVDYELENVRIQSKDLLVDSPEYANSSGGFELYYLIDSPSPSSGLVTEFKENSKIVYLGKEYVILSVKRDTLRSISQYKVVFK